MVENKRGQAVEVVFEDGVLKPVGKIRVLREHERALVYLYPKTSSRGIKSHCGCLGKEDADQMQKIIEEEFEGVEN